MERSSPQYQASKGAVRTLTKLTAVQYARERIRCNSVHPGPIVTPMTEARRGDPGHYEYMVSRIPLGRYGEPDEVAYGVLYLASDEAVVRDGQRAGDRRRLDGPVASDQPQRPHSAGSARRSSTEDGRPSSPNRPAAPTQRSRA